MAGYFQCRFATDKSLLHLQLVRHVVRADDALPQSSRNYRAPFPLRHGPSTSPSRSLWKSSRPWPETVVEAGHQYGRPNLPRNFRVGIHHRLGVGDHLRRWRHVFADQLARPGHGVGRRRVEHQLLAVILVIRRRPRWDRPGSATGIPRGSPVHPPATARSSTENPFRSCPGPARPAAPGASSRPAVKRDEREHHPLRRQINHPVRHLADVDVAAVHLHVQQIAAAGQPPQPGPLVPGQRLIEPARTRSSTTCKPPPRPSRRS